MDKTNLIKIKKIRIGLGGEFKRIEIYFDILNNKLILIGSSAIKTTDVTKNWKEYVIKEVDFNANLNYDFEKIVQEIYNEMVEKEKTLEMIQEIFENVDSVEFKE